MTKRKINLVWLKRDIRLHDHAPFLSAQQADYPFLALFIFEPSIMALPEFDTRHWRFIYEALLDIKVKLEKRGGVLHLLYGEAQDIFRKLDEEFDIQYVFSHYEVGLRAVRERNGVLENFFKSKNIRWKESNQDAIILGAKNRVGWEENRLAFLNTPIQALELSFDTIQKLPDTLQPHLAHFHLDKNISTPNASFQRGGETEGKKYLHSFLTQRYHGYIENISKANETEITCSRISPYISYGCLSLREVYQQTQDQYEHTQDENLEQFLLRLYWRSHYIQKLETEPELEYLPANRALCNLRQEYDDELYQAWHNGETGYPYLDATIRCLEETGYANFRMRATLTTFIAFGLWQDWKRAAIRMANLFLDFEAGIHYGQIQVLAGLTAYHPVRVYSPSAQSVKHDEEGIFAKKWLPELQNVPTEYVAKPWMMPFDIQKKSACIIGENYPERIVDFDISAKIAQRHYWSHRQKQEVFDNLPAIFKRHCIPQDISKYTKSMNLNILEMKNKEKRY